MAFSLKELPQKLEKKMKASQGKSLQARLFRPRRIQIIVILSVLILILALFLCSNTFSSFGQREVVTLTPLGTTADVGEDTQVSLIRWEYDQQQQAMEFELDVDTTYLDDNIQFGVNLLAGSETQIALKAAYYCDTFLVFQAENVPQAAYYQIYCVVSVTSSDGTVSQYQLSFWGAPDSVIQQTESLKLEKTEDEYLLASYDANYSLLNEQLDELTQQENYLNAQIASEQAQISDLQDALDSMTSAERSQANSRIASLQSQRSQNENTLKTVQQSIADTEQEMAALQEKASVL